MTIPGFERPALIRAHLEALEREKRGHTYDERHRTEIEKQIKLFEAELASLIEQGVEDEPEGRTTGRSMLVNNATTGLIHTEWVN
jgi:hypothetical protein